MDGGEPAKERGDDQCDEGEARDGAEGRVGVCDRAVAALEEQGAVEQLGSFRLTPVGRVGQAGRAMTRQREWQLRRQRRGLCRQCGRKAGGYGEMCRGCRGKNREGARRYYRRKAGLRLGGPKLAAGRPRKWA